LRADIDALRIEDQKQTPYRSTVPEVMHACGHDAHTATVFGALVALDRLECDRALPWPVTWRGIFSTGRGVGRRREGDDRGWRAGRRRRNYRSPRRSHAARRHDWRSVGPLTASCDDMRITVRGRGGMRRGRHESNDPIAAAAELVSTLYQFVPRATDSQDAVVVSFGRFMGARTRT